MLEADFDHVLDRWTRRRRSRTGRPVSRLRLARLPLRHLRVLLRRRPTRRDPVVARGATAPAPRGQTHRRLPVRQRRPPRIRDTRVWPLERLHRRARRSRGPRRSRCARAPRGVRTVRERDARLRRSRGRPPAFRRNASLPVRRAGVGADSGDRRRRGHRSCTRRTTGTTRERDSSSTRSSGCARRVSRSSCSSSRACRAMRRVAIYTAPT